MLNFQRFLTEREMDYQQALETLGLKPGFLAAELDAAHKAAVMKYHPDRPGGDTAKMAAANAARDSLKNPSGARTSRPSYNPPTPGPAGTMGLRLRRRKSVRMLTTTQKRSERGNKNMRTWTVSGRMHKPKPRMLPKTL